MTKTTSGRIALIILAAVPVISLELFYTVMRPGDGSASCTEFYAGMEYPPVPALEWCNAGSYFS